MRTEKHPYQKGYFLHAHLPPKVLKKVMQEYDKLGIEAVYCPSQKGSFPSIWGIDVKQYNRKINAIYKNLATEIKLAMNAELRNRK